MQSDNPVTRGMCPALAHEAPNCAWDSEKKEVTTHVELMRDENIRNLEEAAWYQEVFVDNQVNTKPSKVYTAPEALYNLNSEESEQLV